MSDPKRYLSHDATGSLDTPDDTPDLSSDDFTTWLNEVASDSQPSEKDDDFSLDERTVVEVDNPPWEAYFDTNRFLRLDATVARPIEQTYYIDGDEYTFKKPGEELREAQWSLDNRPYPLTHPDSGIVRDVDDVHGFVRNPQYVEHDDEPDESTVSVYVPVNDQQALDFISEFQDVSVGFFNRLDWDVDEDGVDAYQRDIFYDHVAGVRRGRCSGEDGCGLHTTDDARETWTTPAHDVLSGDTSLRADSPTSLIDPAYSGTTEDWSGPPTLTELVAEDNPSWDGLSESTQLSVSRHALVATDTRELPPDSWRDLAGFVVDADGNLVESALVEAYRKAPQMAGVSSYTQAQIRDAVGDLLVQEFGDFEITLTDTDIAPDSDTTDTMSDDCNCGTNDGQILDLDDMSLDAVADRHDDVQALKDRKEELENEVDDKEDTIDDLQDDKELLKDDKEDLKAELDEYRREEFEDKADTLTDLTDHWGDEDELLTQFEDDELSVDDVEEYIERAEDLLDVSRHNIDDADGGGDGGGGGDPTTVGDSAGGGSDGSDGPVFDPETAAANRA